MFHEESYEQGVGLEIVQTTFESEGSDTFETRTMDNTKSLESKRYNMG